MNKEGSCNIRRVPLAYEHPTMTNPNKNSGFIFIPLMDGEDYWNIVESMEGYRQSIATMSGEEWEAIKNAFFGEPHQKFREEIVINGESITPQNPEHLQKLILNNIDSSKGLDPNDFTPIPLSSPDEDGFGYAVYENVEWGTSLGVPVSQIFATREEAENRM